MHCIYGHIFNCSQEILVFPDLFTFYVLDSKVQLVNNEAHL